MTPTLLTLAILLALIATPRAATNTPPALPTVPPPLTPTVPPPLTPTAPTAPTTPPAATSPPVTLPPTAVLSPPAPAPSPSVSPSPSPSVPPSPAPLPPGMLRMNFRNAPLELVLDYLSEAAGFTIVLETEVRGRIDVWNNQPVTRDEALNLLNLVLNKNGYAALQNGRILTIVSRDEAKKRNIPVRSGNDPAGIPQSDEIITQILPIRYINAAQLTKDLQPLLSDKATLTANEAGNALVLTDTQSSIHRMAEIIRALDTSVAGIAAIRVFQMRYADAKTVATVIKEVFQPETGANRGGNNSSNDPRAAFFSRFRGEGESSRGGGNAAAGRTTAASRVVAVADERSNSLVVSSPDELMVTIEDLVKSVDTDVEDVMELRVFRLKNADPNEMAGLLAGLFPDETRSNDRNSSSGGSRFSFFGGLEGSSRRSSSGGGGNSTTGAESDRSKKQSRVLAVADARTASVIVSASRNLMKQIEQMITNLDANPAKKQKVFVYSLENADVQEVETVLKALFESQTGRNTRSTGTTQNNALSNRSGQSQSQGTGNNRLGGGGGGGGNTGLGGGAGIR